MTVRQNELDHSSSGESDTNHSTEAVLSVTDLVKTYGGDSGVTAVDGVNLEVERGTALGILGPNGAGKTTMIKCLLGLIIPTSGSVHVDGIDIQKNPDDAHHRLGATLEGARNVYWRLTVKENLDFFAALAGIDPRERQDRHDRLLAQFDLAEKADTAVRELSRGQKQKTALACTLARDPDVLFLDEPTLGLDIESSIELRTELRSLVNENETTILLSSHQRHIIEDVCDRVIIMNDGKVVANDTIENLLNLFELTRYEITVAGSVPDSLESTLQTKFDAYLSEVHNGMTRFEVTVHNTEFYDLINKLQEASLSVKSFRTIDADLETIFLQVINEDHSDSPSTAESTARTAKSTVKR